MNYFSPTGGHPEQQQLLTGRAVVKDAYTVIPQGVMQDIVTSVLPEFTRTRSWILARPIAGFTSTFAQLAVEISPGGGSDAPEPQPNVQGVIFVTAGAPSLSFQNKTHQLSPGSYFYYAPGENWQIKNETEQLVSFQWIRKAHELLEEPPSSFLSHDNEVTPQAMPHTDGKWSTSRFVDSDDLRHDMHVNIVTFQPGASIPFAETHVMEHGLYVLQGKAVYRLNDDWVEVEAGDFVSMRAFCPQACYAGGPQPFRYLLYKDVNRQVRL
ncbi:bifunctional allantoicase/(S)-ureidoglycine aminohydrolase [Leucobacter sp. UT-8R-CII-1-4]|uniref:bifunctional allantoicase/(S)-ureidoglycine aminohydrolase n=1 Tax=Leucobacter sp. UT-8R-CII-1-4 TaxID=3040075 RepID=UPI0024A9412A|nr:bifunctional allantoicase/(S)-ureidoglycine aminohydrolase [Leucobacter sp. UT-8R-CII-1-4]MDI6023188.1 bifunctional allantoicase/(S)-ureidoglycine aminohydrolase [Leucobacter sp. UT-8R-CII-1-4]